MKKHCSFQLYDLVILFGKVTKVFILGIMLQQYAEQTDAKI